MCEGNIALSNQFKLVQLEDHSNIPYKISSRIFDRTSNPNKLINMISVSKF